MKKLSSEEVKKKLTNISGWSLSNKKIEKEYKFNNFTESLAFSVKVGVEAEKLDHHPDILLHSWNKVKITLTTHSANGLTDNDFILAEKIETL